LNAITKRTKLTLLCAPGPEAVKDHIYITEKIAISLISCPEKLRKYRFIGPIWSIFATGIAAKQESKSYGRLYKHTHST